MLDFHFVIDKSLLCSQCLNVRLQILLANRSAHRNFGFSAEIVPLLQRDVRRQVVLVVEANIRQLQGPVGCRKKNQLLGLLGRVWVLLVFNFKAVIYFLLSLVLDRWDQTTLDHDV
jgi:hypothetical protein